MSRLMTPGAGAAAAAIAASAASTQAALHLALQHGDAATTALLMRHADTAALMRAVWKVQEQAICADLPDCHDTVLWVAALQQMAARDPTAAQFLTSTLKLVQMKEADQKQQRCGSKAAVGAACVDKRPSHLSRPRLLAPLIVAPHPYSKVNPLFDCFDATPCSHAVSKVAGVSKRDLFPPDLCDDESVFGPSFGPPHRVLAGAVQAHVRQQPVCSIFHSS